MMSILNALAPCKPEEKLLADGKNITYSWIRPPADLPDNQRVLAEHIETVLTDFRMRGVSGVRSGRQGRLSVSFPAPCCF